MLTKFLFAVCLLSLPLLAQDRAAINGAVTDPSGAVVPAARIELKFAATGLRRTALTNAEGLYEITPLPVGSYTIVVTKPGFKSVTVDGIDLQYAETRTIDTKLEVGVTTDAVQVEAAIEAVNRTNAEVGGVIESAQIKEIPVSGRNWASLTLLAPGAINYGDGAQRSIRFSGHSLDDSNFTFDGVDTSGVQEQTQKADTRLNIALDAIDEFRVSTTNYTAETGAAGGAQINVVSKSGTNVFHGSGFYAVRNEALDARSPFDGDTLPPFTLHQFGASLGGPVLKDKAFFYANYEGLRQSLGQTFINFVPNAAFRAMVLAKSPVLKPILDAYPMGQIPIDSVTDQLTKVASDTIREDAGMFRFDYRFNDTNTAFFRYNIDNAYIDTPTDALGDHNVIPHVPTNVVLQFQRIISPSMVNEAKFGLNRANYHNWTYGTSPVAVSPGNFDGVSDTALDTEVGTTLSAIDNLTSSNIDVRHNLTANGVYELPFGQGKQFLKGGLPSRIFGGWELTGIAYARTGLPVNITMSRKASALPDGNTSSQRPNLVPGVSIYAAHRTINNWFNPAAFAAPANGTWGNLGRYIANGPGMFEVDSSLQKRFKVTERLALNFRAAAYNLFNHPVYKVPSGSIGSLAGNPPTVSGGFGRITSIINTGAVGTGAPRRIEFMFRAEF